MGSGNCREKGQPSVINPCLGRDFPQVTRCLLKNLPLGKITQSQVGTLFCLLMFCHCTFFFYHMNGISFLLDLVFLVIQCRGTNYSFYFIFLRRSLLCWTGMSSIVKEQMLSASKASSVTSLVCPCAPPSPNCPRLHFTVEIVNAALLSSKSLDVQVHQGQRCVDTKTQKKGYMG